jgi:hypothetical protein
MYIETALNREQEFYALAHLSFYREKRRKARLAPCGVHEFGSNLSLNQYKRSLKAFKANPCWGTLKEMAVCIGKLGYWVSLSCTLSYAQTLSCLQEDFESEFLNLLEYCEDSEVWA